MPTYTNPGAIADVTTSTAIASNWGNAIRDRIVNNFASAAARTSAIGSPVQGQPTYVTYDSANPTTTGFQIYAGSTDGYRPPWNMPWGILGTAFVSANQTGITSVVDLTGLTITVTVPVNRWIRISANGLVFSATAGTVTTSGAVIVEGATQLQSCIGNAVPATGATFGPLVTTISPSAGAHTYKLRASVNTGGGTMALVAAATGRAELTVEDCGPNGNPS